MTNEFAVIGNLINEPVEIIDKEKVELTIQSKDNSVIKVVVSSDVAKGFLKNYYINQLVGVRGIIGNNNRLIGEKIVALPKEVCLGEKNDDYGKN